MYCVCDSGVESEGLFYRGEGIQQFHAGELNTLELKKCTSSDITVDNKIIS